MWRAALRYVTEAWSQGQATIVVALVLAHFLFSIVANAGFRASAVSASWRSFLGWQVIANLAGFVTALALTALLRHIPLHVAYPLTNGLAMLGVQVVAAKWLFREPISPTQWLGTLLVVAGIALIGGR